MSIKDIVDSIRDFLNSIYSDLIKSIKETVSWLYHKDWTEQDLRVIGITFSICLIVFVIKGLLKWAKQESEKERKKKVEQAGEDIDSNGFSRLRKIEENIKEKRK